MRCLRGWSPFGGDRSDFRVKWGLYRHEKPIYLGFHRSMCTLNCVFVPSCVQGSRRLCRVRVGSAELITVVAPGVIVAFHSSAWAATVALDFAPPPRCHPPLTWGAIGAETCRDLSGWPVSWWYTSKVSVKRVAGAVAGLAGRNNLTLIGGQRRGRVHHTASVKQVAGEGAG